LKLIIGFGNPGEKYANNRQNIGFKVIDIVGNNASIDVRVKKKKSMIGRGIISDEEVVLLKPQTFINLIGESVLYIASFLRINVKDVICILEDPTIPLGEMRVDYMYSSLTHEGIKSMEIGLKSDRFAKIRVGISQPPKGMSMESYLYKDFTLDENLVLIDVLNKAEEVLKMLLTHSIEEVQDKYNPEGAIRRKKRTIKPVHIDHKKSEKKIKVK